jgi:hypothetical protein
MIPAQHYFSRLAQLSKDNGLIGQVLHNYSDELLRAADKWGEQTRENQEKHQDPTRLPLPDPWQFLLDAPVVPDRDKAVFRAAQSQNVALRHLFHIAQGIATLNTDWFQQSIEAIAKGDRPAYEHAIGKVTCRDRVCMPSCRALVPLCRW